MLAWKRAPQRVNMSTSIDDEAVLSEQTWRGWEQKRRLREEKAARKRKIAATIILALIATAGTFYLLVVR
jgi:hypothetical protein